MIRTVMTLIALTTFAVVAHATPERWMSEGWRNTDFEKSSIDFSEILSGGPPRDGIPSIDAPKFIPLSDEKSLTDMEPVIGLEINGDARAYPLRILTWHEIVNDEVGGTPVAVTYCPLCNSSIVFERKVDNKLLDFGTTGKLRNSDMVMYDRQTESWWQQFIGTGIVGEMNGVELKSVPSRLESFANFKKRYPEGKVLVPNNPGFRDYGRNPYFNYDSSARPFLYQGAMPEGIEPMARVIAFKVGGTQKAVSMPLLAKKKELDVDGVKLSWSAGQNSALDDTVIAKGRDVGNVVVQKDGKDIVYDVTFAFVINAFHPGIDIVK
ncbi:MAG: DUF3179 domain-containing protein [Hyphomicrobiales bacterium]